MDNRLYFPQQPVAPIQPAKGNNINKPKANSGSNFDQILDQKLNEGLKLSNHARERLKSRNIELSEADLGRISAAVDKARSKGSKDSLILMDNLALVVSVKNNTIITAVDGQSLKENVFTNIDSAVIV